MNKNKFILLFSILMWESSEAQLPVSNIYTLDLLANEQKVLLKNLKYLTEFNNLGYNNQPYFINDDELYVNSNFETHGLSDIFHLNLSTRQVIRMTSTKESEYSPVLMPDQMHFSVVRQEVDEGQIIPQVLWSYPIDRKGKGKLLIPDLKNIGYYSWIAEEKVALYLVGEPSELIIYDIRLKTKTHVAYNIGRCIKTDNKGLVYYVKLESEKHSIKSFDIYLGKSKHVAHTIGIQPDFEILPNGFLISAKESILMVLNPSVDNSWKKVIDLKGAGINNISRIASSYNKIAIVSNQ